WLAVNRVPREKEPGLTIDTFPKAMQAEIEAEYAKKYPRRHPEGPTPVGYEKYVAPPGYSDQYDHFKNFFASVRSRKPVVEDAVFGYRAAGAALLSNLSIERGAVVKWDPDAMKVLS
ncbi:MAG: gfo/Idh/MocA family oxidoreductase, partial [Terracidiphilus sp.]